MEASSPPRERSWSNHVVQRELIILFVFATSIANAQSHLNAEVEQIMHGRKGTAVVLDLKSNKIVGAYHPDVAARRLALPGSTVKAFTLMALIDSGKVKPDEKLVCRSDVHVGHVNVTCNHPQTGQPFNAVSALAYSCNDYFTSMAARLTSEEHRREQMAPAQCGKDQPRAAYVVLGTCQRRDGECVSVVLKVTR